MTYASGKKIEQREDRNFDGKDDVITSFDSAGQPAQVKEDSDGDGSFDTTTVFQAGEKVRTEKDRNHDGKPDLVATYSGGRIVRQEEDADFDGNIDRRSAAGEKGTQVQEADTNGDGRIDTWITTDASGAVVKKEEDRSGDGKPDLVAYFEGGKLRRLEQDSKGKGCVDLRQWFDAAEKVNAEYGDNNGDCKTDVWSFFENQVLVRQGLDTNGDGKPDAFNFLDAGQGAGQKSRATTTAQRISACSSTSRAGDGPVPAGEDKKLNTRALVKGGTVSELLIDGSGKGYADTRQVLSKTGEVVRLDADTNGDHKVDVVQTFKGGALAFQDEDTNFDGVIDQRFQGTTPISVPAGTTIQGEPFGKLECGSFDRFWWKR